MNAYRDQADVGGGLTSPLPQASTLDGQWQPGAGHVVVRTHARDADRGRVEECGSWHNLQCREVVFDVREAIAISDYLVAVRVTAIGAWR